MEARAGDGSGGGVESSGGGGALRLLGERVLRHSGVYLAGTGLELSMTMVRLAILSRLLPIEEFGQLAILLIYAGFVTIGCRLIAVTGTVMSVFRGGDEDGEEEGDQVAQAPGSDEQRRLLGTGLMMSFALTAILGASVALAWRPMDAILVDSGEARTVILATVLGGLHATWYLTSSIARYEKRPGVYIAMQLLQTALSLVAAVVLIEAGYGIDGAIAGTGLGAALALVAAIFLSRHRFALALDRSHVLTVVKRGAPMIAITVSFFLFKNVDLYIVSRYLSDADVALYRVGSRVGSLSAAGISALLLAWGPLARGPIRGAMHREGSLQAASARLFYYYWLLAAWIVVALALLRGFFIKLAPSTYADAELLIPLLGLATVLASGVVVAHRVGLHRRKRALLAAVGFAMFGIVTGLCLWLVPAYGLYGTAASIIGAPALGLVVMLVAVQRSSKPLPLPWLQIGVTPVVGVSWVAVFGLLSELPGWPESVVLGVGAATFPFCLLAARVVAADEARIILGLFRRVIPSSRGHRGVILALEQLADPELDLLDRLVRHGDRPATVARDSGVEETELTIQFVALLRGIGGPQRVSPIEYEVGDYLLSRANVNDRDREGHQLALSGQLGSLELDQLDDTISRIRKISSRRWTTLRS